MLSPAAAAAVVVVVVCWLIGIAGALSSDAAGSDRRQVSPEQSTASTADLPRPTAAFVGQFVIQLNQLIHYFSTLSTLTAYQKSKKIMFLEFDFVIFHLSRPL